MIIEETIQKLIELIVLTRKTIGVALFVRGARLRCGLLGDLADVVAHDRDAVGKLRRRQ